MPLNSYCVFLVQNFLCITIARSTGSQCSFHDSASLKIPTSFCYECEFFLWFCMYINYMLRVYCTCIYVYFSRILSIACGPSTSTFAFAAAASSSHHHMGSSFLTSSLTSPGLPSSRVLTNEMTQFSRPGVIGRSGSSSLRKGELPTAGGVFIWDLKTQKQKVFVASFTCTCACMPT